MNYEYNVIAPNMRHCPNWWWPKFSDAYVTGAAEINSDYGMDN